MHDYTCINDTRNIGASINSTFAPGVIPKDFPYPTSMEKIAGLVPPITRISGPDFIMHFAKTFQCDMLPHRAKYRRKRAFKNDFPERERQLALVAMPKNKVSIAYEQYYIILTYGLDKDKNLTHANLIIPNSDFTRILGSEDLTAYKGCRIVEVQAPAHAKRVVKPKYVSKETLANGEGHK